MTPDTYQQWTGTVGCLGLDKMNDEGLMLLEFAQSHSRLTPASILHHHRRSRLVTRHSQNDLIHNQITFILMQKHFMLNISQAQMMAYPGVDINSDHYLILTNLRLKLKV